MAVLLSPDERFAAAVCSRTLGELPPLLGDDAPELDTVARSLETCLRAAQPRESLLLRTLRRTLECAVCANDDALPRVCGPLHRLATALPAGNIAGDVAAGLLLLFAHGLGQAIEEPAAAAPPKGPRVVMLGFAGGTPSDLRKYAAVATAQPSGERLRLPLHSQPTACPRYRDKLGFDAASTFLVCASEVPEVYERNLEAVLRGVREGGAGAPWAIHLFSKAGFLSLARLLKRLDVCRLQEERAHGAPVTPLPSAIVWDSSPGSMSNYDEFIAGTWSSAEVLARRAQFRYSAEARARMDALLTSTSAAQQSRYDEAVRDSYAPMHSLVIQPCAGACHGLSLPSTLPAGCHHLFLYSDKDPVCSPAEIRGYVSALAAASAADAAAGGDAAVGSCRSARVGGTHCDGLFWSGAEYTAAVRKLFEAI